MCDMDAVRVLLAERADGEVVTGAVHAEVMHRFGLDCPEAEGAILAAGFLPARYRRNQQTISTERQLRLHRSTVAVVGCGGLGGYVIEELARLGVGQLVAIDPDVFEEHNLNRQLLSSPAVLGLNKAQAARRRVADINPGVVVRPVEVAFSPQTADVLFAGVDVVVDAADNVPIRLQLADECSRLNVPLVHGAIAGWYGHVCTVMPGDETLRHLYGRWSEPRGAEAVLGNPSFTPAVVASFEVAEVCKILLELGSLLRHQILVINLLDMEVDTINLPASRRLS
jgi:molybdopterin/thiamine biosynthesis adenylyltransferase